MKGIDRDYLTPTKAIVSVVIQPMTGKRLTSTIFIKISMAIASNATQKIAQQPLTLKKENARPAINSRCGMKVLQHCMNQRLKHAINATSSIDHKHPRIQQMATAPVAIHFLNSAS